MLRKFFCFICIAPLIVFGQATVTSHIPEKESIDVALDHSIVITMSEEISPFSAGNAGTITVFGKWSGPMDFSLDFNSTFDEITLTPTGSFIAGEMVTVNISTALLNSNSDPMEHGYSFQYWTKTEPGSLDLELIQEIEMKLEGEIFIQCYGAYAGDINDDGYSDLTVINENANDLRVLLNDGLGTYDDFTIYGMPSGNKPSPSEGADFNSDGIIDLAVSHVQSDIVSVLMGDGSGGFLPEVACEVDNGVRGLTILDIEGDGDADIVTANRNASTIGILKNNGNGVFDDISIISGFGNDETSVVAADVNGNGIMDLFVGAFNGNEIFTMINDGQGNFTEGGSVSVIGRPWMIAAGDVNNDGYTDVVSANSNGNRCSVHFGDGNGGFLSSASYNTGGFPLSIDLGDLDGDGDLDMITSNYSGINYSFFENDGNGIFINPITYPATSAGSCAIFHDRDNNGTMDLSLIDELADVVFLYKNAPLSVAEFSLETNLTVSPNPFKEELTVTAEGITKDRLDVFDQMGRLILSIQPYYEGNTTRFSWKPANNIASGIYLLKLQGTDNSIKVIKQ